MGIFSTSLGVKRKKKFPNIVSGLITITDGIMTAWNAEIG